MKVGDPVRVQKDGSAYSGQVGYIVRPGRRPGFWHVQFPLIQGQTGPIRRNYAEKDLVRVLTNEEAEAVLKRHVTEALRLGSMSGIIMISGDLGLLVDGVMAAVADAAAEVKGA